MKYIKRYVWPKIGIDNGVIYSATEKLNRGYIDFKGGGSEGHITKEIYKAQF